ncbi:MAG: hypothetical protein WCK65_13000, partial [Rhodospirillaceae bacterium]
MGMGNFAGRFKIGTRIYTGFIIVLALLAAVSWISIHGLNVVERNLTDYIRISSNSLMTESIATKLANMRRHVVLYVDNGEMNDVNAVRKFQTELGTELKKLREGTVNAARRANQDRMIELLESYSANFTKLVELHDRRDKLVNEGMDPLGSGIRRGLTEIADSAHKDGQFETSSRVGRARESLMQARVVATQFLLKPDNKTAEAVRMYIKEFGSRAGELIGGLTEPYNIELCKKAIEDGKKYLVAFEAAAKDIFAV